MKHNTARLYKTQKKKWPASETYKISITNFATGKVECCVAGTVWAQITKPEFKTQKMENYQMGSELFHSVDQHPGTSGNKCTISDAKVKVGGAWQNTTLAAGDVKITDYDKNGNTINPASSHEWGYSNVTARGYKMWDKKVEY